MSFEMSAILFSWVAIALLGFAMAGIVRQVHVLREGLQPRIREPGPIIGGQAASVRGVSMHDSSLLIFADSSCGKCDQVLAEFLRTAEASQKSSMVVLYRGPANGLSGVRTLPDQEELFEQYNVSATPFAVLVNRGVIIAARPVGSVEIFREFVERARERGELT